MKKLKFYIPILIALFVSTWVIYMYMNTEYIYPISEIDNLEEPYINLKTFETSFKLVPKSDDPEMSSPLARMSSWILKGINPWSTIAISQTYFAYSLEDESKLEREIYLWTDYYSEIFPLTINMVLKKNSFNWPTIYNLEKYERDDDRFDKCIVSEWPGDIKNYRIGLKINSIEIIVAKNNQIMYLDYYGGNLTVDDLLDELDRIL